MYKPIQALDHFETVHRFTYNNLSYFCVVLHELEIDKKTHNSKREMAFLGLFTFIIGKVNSENSSN